MSNVIEVNFAQARLDKMQKEHELTKQPIMGAFISPEDQRRNRKIEQRSNNKRVTKHYQLKD